MTFGDDMKRAMWLDNALGDRIWGRRLKKGGHSREEVFRRNGGLQHEVVQVVQVANVASDLVRAGVDDAAALCAKWKQNVGRRSQRRRKNTEGGKRKEIW